MKKIIKTIPSPKLSLKIFLCLSFWFVFLSLVLAEETENQKKENLYLREFLELDLEIKGDLSLKPTTQNAQLDFVKAELFLFPRNTFRQQVKEKKTSGKLEGNKVVFEWSDGKIEKKEFSFQALLKTKNKKIKVDKKIPFPLEKNVLKELKNYSNYLKETKTIDKNHPQIIKKAAALAEGEDDLFRVVFKLARWVEENINYELDTLTAEVSQKASWVLKNKKGVCDEMTSLFIALSRSLGIPARFVSGISYTTSSLFKENWIPHGWAEVYFPGYGWLSFDLAFGEFGYVDVTHLKLKDSLDPSETSTKFEWIGHQVNLKASDLSFSVTVKEKGPFSKNELSLEISVLGKEVRPGSYNLVRGIVKNQNPYYLSTSLKLATPPEITIIGKEKKIILMEPQETKEIFWIIKVKENLPKYYSYEFPLVIYSENNLSQTGKFKATPEGLFLTKEEVKKLKIKKEEKKYLGKIDFNCSYPPQIKFGTIAEILCSVKNKGNFNLKNLKFCIDHVCKNVTLFINQEEKLKIKIKGEKKGRQKLIVSGENNLVEKKIILEYLVIDDPQIILTFTEGESRKKIAYGQDLSFSLKLTKNSFSIPQNVTLFVSGPRFENKWELTELTKEQLFSFQLPSPSLGKQNKIKIKLRWEDKEGNLFEEEKTFLVEVIGQNFWEEFLLWLNSFLNLFY